MPADYISKVFERMNIQQIRYFLLYGAEEATIDNRPYTVRLKSGSEPINKRLASLYPDKKELDNANDDLSKALTAYEKVYMELGMKAGARLAYQLLFSDDPQPAESD